MRFQLFAVLLVVTGSYALPRYGEVVEPNKATNMMENVIRRYIKLISTKIEKAGLDPLEVVRRDIEINTDNSDCVVKGFLENVRFSGASDIRINTLEYSYLFNTLHLDVFLPEVSLTIGDSGIEAIVVGKKIDGQLKGSLSIKTIRLAGVGYFEVNMSGDITLHIVSFNFSIGGIESDLSVIALGIDHSEFVNTLFNEKIPDFLEDNKYYINRVLENILNSILNSSWKYWKLIQEI